MNTTKSYLKHRLVALLKCWMLAFALLTTTSMNLFSQEATSGEATSIKTKDIENKSVREIFSILETRYALKIAFQEGDSTFYQPVALPDAKTISLPDLLKVLEKNIPYNVIHKNGYIIFQKKNLQKKYILKGNVKDANSDQKLVTASVYIKQSGQGLLTDDNGAYTFELKPGSYDVVVKFMGYNDKVIHINLYDDQTLNTKLEENYYSISEVDITATRTIANNFEVGRTIERLDSKEIGSVTTGNVMDALHARIPGVRNNFV